jgi:hypothetical protein
VLLFTCNFFFTKEYDVSIGFKSGEYGSKKLRYLLLTSTIACRWYALWKDALPKTMADSSGI